jgi:hypothetical protein
MPCHDLGTTRLQLGHLVSPRVSFCHTPEPQSGVGGAASRRLIAAPRSIWFVNEECASMSQSNDEVTEGVPRDDDRDAASGLRHRGRGDEPDVLLDVSELRVDEISLEVQDLTAHVSLEANVLDLLRLHVGVDATLGGVKLTIKGVEAKVLLKVRLDNVVRILDRVFDTIDNNPEIIGQVTGLVGQAAAEVGAGPAEVVDVVTSDGGPAIAAGGEPE